MKLENFHKIEGINRARAKQIINWYERTRDEISIGNNFSIGIRLHGLFLIKLLTIFGNSKHIERDVARLFHSLYDEGEEQDVDKMELKNFSKIEAIDEDRAIKIIKFCKRGRFNVGISAGGLGIGLGAIWLIQLLTISGNSKDIQKDFDELLDNCFGADDGIEDYQLRAEGQEKRRKNQFLDVVKGERRLK